MVSGRHGRRVMRRTKRCTGKVGPQYTCCSSDNPPAANSEFDAVQAQPFVKVTSRIQTQNCLQDWTQKSARAESAAALAQWTRPTAPSAWRRMRQTIFATALPPRKLPLKSVAGAAGAAHFQTPCVAR